MKYQIIEKSFTWVIFIDAHCISTLCQIADLIEKTFPESVNEVTHNRKANQGNIIIQKQDSDMIDKIKKLIHDYTE